MLNPGDIIVGGPDPRHPGEGEALFLIACACAGALFGLIAFAVVGFKFF